MVRMFKIALVAAVVGSSVLSGPVMAQEGEDAPVQLRAPQPRRSDEPPFLWNLLAVIVIAGSIFGVNMIPSKRGHQD
jgi:hypothetical protein